MPPVSMDSFSAELNPCSVESIPEPVELVDGRRVWPIMLGCYELQEDGTRRGRLELYSVQVPDLDTCTKTGHSMLLRFGQPQVILGGGKKQSLSGGILDGKWIQAPGTGDGNAPSSPSSWWYATAHSTGEITIHSCSVPSENHDDGIEYMASHPGAPFAVRPIGSSESKSSDERPSLCLSLNWNNTYYSDSNCSMVSSYSDGRVAIHDVAYSELTKRLHMIERESWGAHTLFTTPAEVWSACFVGETTVFSCGDDGTLKYWDIRCVNRPLQVLKHFDAGVTVVAPHPRHEHLLACGSYDETICLYDIRYLTPKKPLGRSAPLGGGIWRLKWHPTDDTRILVAAMHGGCRIVQVDELQDIPVMSATKEFTEHKSMAYGADWLVCNHPTQEGYFEAAASCSFYDKAVHLWDTVA